MQFGADMMRRKQEAESYEDFCEKNPEIFKDIEDDKYLIAACNGWVMGPAIKFVDP